MSLLRWSVTTLGFSVGLLWSVDPVARESVALLSSTVATAGCFALMGELFWMVAFPS